MIPTKSRRLKAIKLSKNIERIYKEVKCRECAVVVTRMDFAKILGKFTKVKIQYESSNTPKGKLSNESSINSKARLKSNENGMVHRNNQHPAKDLTVSRKPKVNEPFTPNTVNNILKENNRLKNSVIKDKNSNYDRMTISPDLKQYGIIFTSPVSMYQNDFKSKISLAEILHDIDDGILPSEEWCIDYFPKNDEPKDDKVYDRIAAELEDLMNSGKPLAKAEKSDEFPSILDILNDNTNETTKSTNQSSSIEFKSNLESSDVEAMLLGKPDASRSPSDPMPMEVDNPDVSTLIADVDQLNAVQAVEPSKNLLEADAIDEMDNPHSPSILDEALQKGIEEHLPPEPLNNTRKTQESKENTTIALNDSTRSEISFNDSKKIEADQTNNIPDIKNVKNNIIASKAATITEVVFKMIRNGECYKSVTCAKNLKYNVEIDGKSVEFLGAPKYVSTLEDVQVLLQIVHESELKSFYVLQ